MLRPDARKILLFLVQPVVAFMVGAATYFGEAATYHTAYGGPVTVLIDLFIYPFLVSAIVTIAALLAHLLTLLPMIQTMWRPIRFIIPIFIPIGFALIVFASKLGLRHTEPIGNYKLMDPAYWWTAYFFILFPIINFRLRRTLPPQAPGRTVATPTDSNRDLT